MDALEPISECTLAIYDFVFHSVLFHIVTFVIFLKLYAKLTVGMCDSDRDMTGKTVLITGASAGIGEATAMELARRNARVIMACRNLEKAKRVAQEITLATGNTDIKIKHLDLESFDSVRQCAEDVIRTERKLDVLINNAGTTDYRVTITKDGCEKIMQSNHLGHFLLTLLLLDLLKKGSPSRIINVSSCMYAVARLDPQDMAGTKENLFRRHTGNLYSRSKLANILFTRELASRLAGTGVTVNALHPGFVASDIVDGKYDVSSIIVHIVLRLFGKTVHQGAQTSVYLAVHPDVEETTGKYFYDCRERSLFYKALDDKLAEQLFKVSEEAVGASYPRTVS